MRFARTHGGRDLRQTWPEETTATGVVPASKESYFELHNLLLNLRVPLSQLQEHKAIPGTWPWVGLGNQRGRRGLFDGDYAIRERRRP